MSAHTPVPWDWFTDPITGSKEREGHCMRFLVGSDGQGFAHTVGLMDDVDEANARLICAAPDLLALAHAVAKHFDGTDAPLGIQARAAINAAEGREA